MIGDTKDMARRIAALLPRGWFADETPILAGLLAGTGIGWSAIYALIQAVIQAARLTTATGTFIDSFAADFFGSSVQRTPTEGDNVFRNEVTQALLCSRTTRTAVAQAIMALTDKTPVIFEPARPADTGSYSAGGAAYCCAGGWGNLDLPFQVFITIYRPSSGAIGLLAGYGTGGYEAYGSLTSETMARTDAQLMALVPPFMPAACIAWCRVSP